MARMAHAQEALGHATHTRNLHAEGLTHVRLDHLHHGLGSNSCSPIPQPEHRLFATGDYAFTVRLRAFHSDLHNPATLARQWP